MSAITIDGDLVHYERLGKGRPVILVHGWLGSWRYWIPLMQHLHLKYSVYTLDLQGFGDSAKNPNRYTVARYTDTLVQFMDQLAITKAAMIGHALGAMVITELALRHPEKVARMLLSSVPLFDPGDLKERVPAGTRVMLTANTRAGDTVPSASSSASTPAPAGDATLPRRPSGALLPTDHEMPTIARPEIINRDKLREAFQQRDAAPPPPPRNPLLEVFTGKNPLALLDRSVKKSEPVYDKLKVDVDKTDTRVLESSAGSYDAGRMLDNLRLVSVPVCVVHGTDDPLLPAPGEDLWNYLSVDKDDSFVLLPLPGVRHFPMLEHEPFLRLTTDFLSAEDLSKLEIRERWKRRSR
ncbi:MAG: alpha/beta hydrolase [Anaerolineae bacterium]|jgi:pimeloyl-ACP methyl ester carboxylesterase|nr:alpha/beta hydrolase [Anaerolineae bacterium]